MNPTFLLALAWVLTPAAHAASSNQPYIDELLDEMGSEVNTPRKARQSIEDERQALKAKAASEAQDEGGSYIDELRRDDPSLQGGGGSPSSGLIEREKAKLAPKPGNPSAIQSFKDGKDRLEMKRDMKVRFAGGFRINASTERDYSGGGGTISYDQLYGARKFPDFTLFFEWQPWHSEWVGNLGAVASVGYTQARSPGVLGVALPQAWSGGGTFSTTSSSTNLTFIVVPVSAGLNFRLNTLRVIRPYVQAQGTTFFYMERRNDGLGAAKSYSLGYTLGGGVNIPLDWISRESTWDLYEESGVKRFSFTIDYSIQDTIKAMPVTIASSALSLGFTYEF